MVLSCFSEICKKFLLDMGSVKDVENNVHIQKNKFTRINFLNIRLVIQVKVLFHK